MEIKGEHVIYATSLEQLAREILELPEEVISIAKFAEVDLEVNEWFTYDNERGAINRLYLRLEWPVASP